ncbi:MAG TPA: adenylosuccinate lyase [Spirochaetota bacterium]|nr:adenylosuccinate lyase [Spirochaetota bacterium]
MIERYCRPQMKKIWENENKYRLWLDIEIAACEVNAGLGIVPEEDLKIIKEKAAFSVARIDEIESQVHHDVIAFLTSVAENVGESSRFIHYGLTSSDIGDTALCLQMKQAGEIILSDIDLLIEALKKKALEHKKTPCMGRSHGVHAEPTTFGLKMLLYYEAFKRNRERLAAAVKNISFGKLSGAVGTFSNIDPVVEKKVCEKLGLSPDPVSTQVISRDRHAEFMSAIAITAASLDDLAVEIRHLQRTEVREAEEPFQKGQKGSSAMPHKRNPILCERISGIARVIKSNMLTALDNVTLWHERDISHSSAERVILPDSTLALDYILDKMTFVISGLIIYPDAMMDNMNRTGGLHFSQSLLLALVESGITREDAYRLVQGIAMRTWNREGTLFDLASADKEISAKIGKDDLKKIFSLDNYYNHIDLIYKKTGLQ